MEHLDSKRLPDILIGQVIRRSHKNQGDVHTRSSVSAYMRIFFYHCSHDSTLLSAEIVMFQINKVSRSM